MSKLIQIILNSMFLILTMSIIIWIMTFFNEYIKAMNYHFVLALYILFGSYLDYSLRFISIFAFLWFIYYIIKLTKKIW